LRLPSWYAVFVVGGLAMAIAFTSREMANGKRGADHNLLGEHNICVESVAFDPRGRFWDRSKRESH
jgi:hypothetical protein